MSEGSKGILPIHAFEFESTSPKLSELDPELVTAPVGCENIEHLFLSQKIASGFYVILPAMPRASDALVLQYSLCDRSALMGAHAIDGLRLALYEEQSDDLPLNDELLATAFGKIGTITEYVPSHNIKLRYSNALVKSDQTTSPEKPG